MRKSWSPIQEQMPACCLQLWQRRSIKISEDLVIFSRRAAFAAEILAEGVLERDRQDAVMSMTSRSPTTMQSFRPGRGLVLFAVYQWLGQQVYEVIVRRFLSIFYPPAIYQKASLITYLGKEKFFSNFRILMEEGYLKVTPQPDVKEEKG